MKTIGLLSLICLFALSSAGGPRSKSLITVHEENWEKLLKGEWMVEFHAPWCPACKDLQKAWNAFADWSKDLNINVAEVDVTTNPGLSGRFLVTALPTIYHVKDGVFRQYTGPRDKNDFITFIEEKKWSMIEPVPSYKRPDSHQMAVVAVFFKLSMTVRDLHNHLVENVGVPSWASYSMFAGVTLALGCVLGFIIVCIIDYVFPTGTAAARKAAAEAAVKKKDQQKKGGKDAKNSKEASQESSQSSSQGEGSSDESQKSKKSEKSPAPTKKNESKKVK